MRKEIGVLLEICRGGVEVVDVCDGVGHLVVEQFHVLWHEADGVHPLHGQGHNQQIKIIEWENSQKTPPIKLDEIRRTR
jgi:hypothetical protein